MKTSFAQLELEEWRRSLYGLALYQVRKSRKLTQESLAARVGMSRTTLVALEKGKQAATVDQLARIAAELGVDVTVFFPLDLSKQLTGVPGIPLSERAKTAHLNRRRNRR